MPPLATTSLRDMVNKYTRYETKTFLNTEQKRRLFYIPCWGIPVREWKQQWSQAAGHLMFIKLSSHIMRHSILFEHQWDPCVVDYPVGSIYRYLFNKKNGIWCWKCNEVEILQLLHTRSTYRKCLFWGRWQCSISSYKGNGNKSNSKVSKLWVIQISVTWLGSLTSLCSGKPLALFRLLGEDRESDGYF